MKKGTFVDLRISETGQTEMEVTTRGGFPGWVTG